MARTEYDLQAALLTLAPDPATDASVIDAVHRKISRRRTVHRTSVITASVAAVGVAASLVLAPTPSTSVVHHHHPGTPRLPVSALGELRTLAKVAAVQRPFQLPGPGQFWYTVTFSAGGVCLKAIDPHEPRGYDQNCLIHVLEVVRTRMWIAADGSGRATNAVVSARFPSARDRAHWIAAGRPNLNLDPADTRFRKHELSITTPGLGKLPTNEARLAKLIRSRKWEGGPPGPAEDFTQVGDLLRFPDAPPKLRAAAFEVGAHIRGVTSLGQVTFHGVTGAAIIYSYRLVTPISAYKGAYVKAELIFDRATSTLEAEVHEIIKAGKVMEMDWVTYPVATLVNSMRSTPAQ